ncbi:MAG: hypothetical protein KKG76_12115, partial [Euryarchaeota archaeon]|nr:hypothetical protein [Euryarchaeota archaeon]
MSWHLHENIRKTKTYISLKKNEKEVSYSGEKILGSIANSINFSKVLEKYTKDRRIAEALN